jgi:hypothetical protein
MRPRAAPAQERSGPVTADREPFDFGGTAVAPGDARTVELPLGALPNGAPVALSVRVLHGRRDGPTVFVSAAVHGDEIVGVEIVRRLSRAPALQRLAGTLLLVPVVNVYGFIGHSRYLPDRRDLNRSFPGVAGGSLAARLAHCFFDAVVARCDCGIDLHSAPAHRVNLPHIRISPDDAAARTLADAFAAPLILESRIRAGSLRDAARDRDVTVLVYEAGEALRFDEIAIRVGVRGVLRVLCRLGMVRARGLRRSRDGMPLAAKSGWLRAPDGGLLRALRTIGDSVKVGETVGLVSDPLGEAETPVTATAPGLIVGCANLPLVNRGDALFHVAQLDNPVRAAKRAARIAREVAEDPMLE